MRRALVRRLAPLAVLVAVLLGDGAPRALARDPLTIDLGVLTNLSQTGDPDTQVALRLAAEDINAFLAARGSFRRVRLIVEGTGLEPAVALEKITRFAASGLGIVIGPESSAEVAAIKPFTDARGMVLLSHCSTAISLAIPGDSVYRMVPSDLRQAAAIARLIASSGKRAVVPMWRADVFGDDITAALRSELAALGVTVLPGVRFDPDATDFSADLTALAAQVQQAVAAFGGAVGVAFFGFGTDGAAVLARATDVPVLGTVDWYGSDGTAESREILENPRAARFAVRTRFRNTLFADLHTPKADALRARISAGIGGGNVYFCAMAAYDAVWLSVLSALAAGPVDVEGFKRALVEIADSYEGATGPTTLDAAGDRAEGAYDIWVIREEDGRFVWRALEA